MAKRRNYTPKPAKAPYEPTPEEIERLKAEIREEWQRLKAVRDNWHSDGARQPSIRECRAQIINDHDRFFG